MLFAKDRSGIVIWYFPRIDTGAFQRRVTGSSLDSHVEMRSYIVSDLRIYTIFH
jgi:hypothetical protein